MTNLCDSQPDHPQCGKGDIQGFYNTMTGSLMVAAIPATWAYFGTATVIGIVDAGSTATACLTGSPDCMMDAMTPGVPVSLVSRSVGKIGKRGGPPIKTFEILDGNTDVFVRQAMDGIFEIRTLIGLNIDRNNRLQRIAMQEAALAKLLPKGDLYINLDNLRSPKIDAYRGSIRSLGVAIKHIDELISESLGRLTNRGWTATEIENAIQIQSESILIVQ